MSLEMETTSYRMWSTQGERSVSMWISCFTNPFIHGYIYQKPQLTKVKQVMRVNLAITNHLYMFLNPRSCCLNNHFPMVKPLAFPYRLGAPPIGSNAQRIARPLGPARNFSELRSQLKVAMEAWHPEKSLVLGDLYKTRHTYSYGVS